MSERAPIKLSELVNIGEQVDEIELVISYKIIDLFSGQLYSSPSKAIEELVVNSYDAFASNCYVYVSDVKAPEARIAVFDDGEGMNINGLKELWMIAETRKRDKDREAESIKKGRLPIGKFGIGKLASYIVGNKITHITKKNNDYLIVTMDYSLLNYVKENERFPLTLRRIELEEVKNIFTSVYYESSLPFEDWENEPNSWTLVVMTDLKSKGIGLSLGRLRWIISTALPLVPDFQCYLNNIVVEPSKLSQSIMKEWIIGKDDLVADKLKYEVLCIEEADESKYQVNIPDIGPIWGIFELYHNSIARGKSEDIARSNGFFIMVRGRLINLKNPYFGLSVLSHSTFSRFRAVIHADGLDKYIVVHREDIEKAGYDSLQTYLHSKFNEIRDFYGTEISRLDTKYAERYEELPPSLIKYPIRHAFEVIKTEGYEPYTIKPPEEIDETTEAVEAVKEVKLEELTPDLPIAEFDLETGILKANTAHPFRNNFANEKSYQSWAVAEAFLELYMIEAGISNDKIKQVLKKRDKLLRVLVQKGPRPVNIISNMLRETTHLEKIFEIACGDAFQILGLEVSRLGGRGKPEGYAVANLGIDSQGVQRSYKIIYDAKSTGSERVQTGNLHVSATNRHREDYSADYAIIIAPEFQDTKGEDSAIWKEARQNEVQIVRARDLADLLDYSAVKALPLSFLRTFFECRTTQESFDWIKEFEEKEISIPPIKLLLSNIYDLQIKDKRDPPTYGAIKQVSLDILGDTWGINDIKEWLTALSRFVPSLIITEENAVHLEQTPDNIIQQIINTISQLSDPSIGSDIIRVIS